MFLAADTTILLVTFRYLSGQARLGKGMYFCEEIRLPNSTPDKAKIILHVDTRMHSLHVLWCKIRTYEKKH
jgi:hypothetical protein